MDDQTKQTQDTAEKENIARNGEQGGRWEGRQEVSERKLHKA